MSKAKFERTKPHVRYDRSRGSREDDVDGGDHGGPEQEGLADYVPFDQIDKAPEEKARGHDRDGARGVRDGEPSLRARGLPGSCGLREEHDHGCGADGRRDPGGEAADGPMPQTREHILLGAPGGSAVHRGVPEQGGHGGRRRAAGAGRARGAGAVEPVRVSGGRDPAGEGSAR